MVLLTGSDVLGQPRGLATKSAFGLLFLAFIALSGLDSIDGTNVGSMPCT